jgi:hypothetical protein
MRETQKRQGRLAPRRSESRTLLLPGALPLNVPGDDGDPGVSNAP